MTDLAHGDWTCGICGAAPGVTCNPRLHGGAYRRILDAHYASAALNSEARRGCVMRPVETGALVRRRHFEKETTR